jgi:hypothetical protein
MALLRIQTLKSRLHDLTPPTIRRLHFQRVTNTLLLIAGVSTSIQARPERPNPPTRRRNQTHQLEEGTKPYQLEEETKPYQLEEETRPLPTRRRNQTHQPKKKLDPPTPEEKNQTYQLSTKLSPTKARNSHLICTRPLARWCHLNPQSQRCQSRAHSRRWTAMKRKPTHR